MRTLITTVQEYNSGELFIQIPIELWSAIGVSPEDTHVNLTITDEGTIVVTKQDRDRL